MLYQALVDRLAPAIEGALATRAQVMAYRQTLDEDASNPFAGTPSFVDYADRVDQIIDEQIPSPRLLSPFDRTGPKRPGYVLSTDLSGYFMHIDVDELERSLLALSSPTDVVRDLGDLLRFWRFAGVRGLPQGVRASSPLANLYLAPLDSLLTEMGVAWVRWMDDITVTARKYADARQILDAAEKLLYQRGLTLNSAKTSIKRANPEASPIPPDALVRRKEAERGRSSLGEHTAPTTISPLPTPSGRQRQAPGRHMPWSRFSESRATNATLGTSDGAARGGTSAT
jgi:hypothetical protein